MIKIMYNVSQWISLYALYVKLPHAESNLIDSEFGEKVTMWINDTRRDTLWIRFRLVWITREFKVMNCSLNDYHQSPKNLFYECCELGVMHTTMCDLWLFIWLIHWTESLTHHLFFNRSNGEPVAWWWPETASSSSPSSVSSWCSAAVMTSVGSSGKDVTEDGLPDWDENLISAFFCRGGGVGEIHKGLGWASLLTLLSWGGGAEGHVGGGSLSLALLGLTFFPALHTRCRLIHARLTIHQHYFRIIICVFFSRQLKSFTELKWFKQLEHSR